MKGSEWTEKFSLAVLELSEAGLLSSIRGRWWPAPGECPRASPHVLAHPAPVTLDLYLYHMAPPFILLSAAILLAITMVLIEIFTDKSISSKTKYLKCKVFRLHTCNENSLACVTHVATQTILWASPRATPPPGFKSNLSKKLYTSDGQIAQI